MGAIVLDASKVNLFVLPNLNKSKSNIQDAYSTSILLKNNIPGSFNYKLTINEIVNQIYEIKREINDISGIINNKLDYAKKIETKTECRANSVASLASSIGAVVGAIGGATIGSATRGIVSASIGAVVGSKVGSSVSKNIVKTGAKTTKCFVSGVKKIGSSILNGLKKTGSKIVSGVKTAANWVKDTTKTVTNWVSDKFNAVKDWTSKALKDTGSWISNTAKAVWSWITGAASTVWTHIKKIGASFVNGVLSIVKGLVRLVESLGDLVVLLGSGLATGYTALYDIGKGLCTGKLDWSATKGLWKKTKAVVAYDWTSKCIFDPLYNSKFGKWLDNNAYGWFKTDGIGCQILEGVGYVAGVIAISCVTLGAGGVALAAPTAASMAATATAAGIGKYTAEEWNKNSLSITYGDQEINLAIDYEKYSEIEKLKDGQSTSITQQLIGEDGKPFNIVFIITKKGDTYSIVDSAGNVAKFNGVVESNTAKGLLIGGIKGAWEGAQYYVGGKIGASNFGKITNSITDPTTQVLARSGIRIGLDTLTGVAEVPFQSAVTMFSEGKNWNEAWEASGGWKAVGTQAGIAGIMSTIGEAIPLKKAINQDLIVTTKDAHSLNNEIASQLDEVYVDKKLEDSIDILISKEKGGNGKIAGVELFKRLGNDNKPSLVSVEEFSKIANESKYGVLYRGICGDNAQMYVDQFKTGELYVGGANGSIRGTGIYTGYGESAYESVASSYASAGGTSNSGKIMEMVLAKDAKIVDFDTIVSEQAHVLDSMSKKFSQYDGSIVDLDSLQNNLSKIMDVNDLKQAQYIVNTLTDPGYYAALRGYDAIDVVDKKYLNVLNRGKLIMIES